MCYTLEFFYLLNLESENKENISVNRPVEEINITTRKVEYEEKNIPTIDAYLPQKQAFKSSKIQDIKGISTSPEMYSGTDKYRVEEKLSN